LLSENKYYLLQSITARQRIFNLSLILLIVVIGLVNVYFNPLEYFFTEVFGIPSVNGCPLFTFTGVPCPMCGLGRVFSCITDLYFMESLYYNPLGLVFYIILALVLGILTILNVFGKKITLKKPAMKLWYIPVLFVLVMWLLNIFYGNHS